MDSSINPYCIDNCIQLGLQKFDETYIDNSDFRIALFIEEAELLFENKENIKLTNSLLKSLMRKGIGIYFITSHVDRIPSEIILLCKNYFIQSLREYSNIEKRSIDYLSKHLRNDKKVSLFMEMQKLTCDEVIISSADENGEQMDLRSVAKTNTTFEGGSISEKQRRDIIEMSYLFGKYYFTFSDNFV